MVAAPPSETRLRPRLWRGSPSAASGFGEVRPAHLFQGDISPKQKTSYIHPRTSSGSSAQADKSKRNHHAN